MEAREEWNLAGNDDVDGREPPTITAASTPRQM
jgi:hypothetical protein